MAPITETIEINRRPEDVFAYLDQLEPIEVEGLFGYTEDDGTLHGRTPLAIKRATMILALRSLPAVGNVEARDAAHAKEIRGSLEAAGFVLRPGSSV